MAVQIAQENQTGVAANLWRDLLAGLVAIVAVLASAIRAAVVGSDLRVLFSVSLAAFFVAGLVRGRSEGRTWIRALVISSPGLLGTAALIVNDGLHRWPISIAITLLCTVFTAAGVQTRRQWSVGRVRSSLYAVASATALPMIAALFVPALVTFSSVKKTIITPPAFAMRTSAGEVVTSEALHGRVVVLAVWATWCLPCRWELPEVERAYRHFQGDQRVAFFAVDRGGGQETPARAKRYLDRSGMLLPLAFEEEGFAQALGADALPTLVVLDAQGRTRLVHHGYDASEHLDDLLIRTVGELVLEDGVRKQSSQAPFMPSKS